jgi:D-alanyl-D-alanine carboxypeptidase
VLIVNRAPAGVLAIVATTLICAFLAMPAWAARHHARHRHVHHRAHHTVSAYSPTVPSKDAAMIIDGETGKVLYSRHADLERHPASLTKLMTLYMLFKALKSGQMTLQTPMRVSAHAAAQQPTKLYLKPGQTITVDDAIRSIVIISANDVAVVIAEALGGTESHFAQMMNREAHAMGLHNTNYHNASGLPDPLQITTASDLAVIARHVAYDFPQYFHYFGITGFDYHGRHYRSHDHLVGSYEGADGMKTGFTDGAGFNLVTSVVRGNMNIIGVVMGGRTARSRDGEMVRLLNDTFTKIAANPTLVAHAAIPWRQPARIASALPGNIAIIQAQTPPPLPRPTVQAQLALASPEIRPAARPGHGALVQIAQVLPQARPATRLALRGGGQGDSDEDAAPAPTDSKHNWTIQIGAYSDRHEAREQLANYAKRSMDVLGQATRIVVPFQSVNGHTLFRARFGLFAERKAREVCGRLTQRGQTCFAALSTR